MQTVRILSTHVLFRDVGTLVIEPDTTVNYHRNYEKYGLLTGLQTPPLVASKDSPDHVPARAYARYRRQIDLSEVQFASMWFTLASHPGSPGGLGDTGDKGDTGDTSDTNDTGRASKKRRAATAPDELDSALPK